MTPEITALIIAIVLSVLQTLVCWLKKPALSYIVVFCHILAFAILLYVQASLELIFLVFLASTTIYFASRRLFGPKVKEDENE